MTSQKTIQRLRKQIQNLDDRILNLELENMGLREEAKKYENRYLGLVEIFHTPGILIQTVKRDLVKEDKK